MFLHFDVILIRTNLNDYNISMLWVLLPEIVMCHSVPSIAESIEESRWYSRSDHSGCSPL